MMYIGVRSCECLPEDDDYWGSSKHLPRGKKKKLNDLCDKFILGTFESRKDAVADEIRRHEENDVAISELFWNKAKQTSKRFDTTGVPSYNKGVPFSKEARLNMSRGRKSMKLSAIHKQHISEGNLGNKHTEKSKRKMSESKMGSVVSSETKAKLSKSHLGLKHSEETKAKMSKTRKGVKFSDKHKKALSNNHFTKRDDYVSACLNRPQEKITCPYCGINGGIPSMKRWHFDNCKFKENT